MTIHRSKLLPLAAFLLLAATSGLSAQSPSLNYPMVTFPVENQFSSAKAILGKIIFWDEQFSSTNTTACGTCHIPSAGGSDPRSNLPGSNHPGPNGILGDFDDVIGSRGVINATVDGDMINDGTFFPDVSRTGRKTPTMIDSAFYTDLFWDGRASSEFVNPVSGVVEIASGGALESQAVGPPLSNVEMSHENRAWASIESKLSTVKPLRLATNLPADIVAALAVNPTYQGLFAAAYGDTAVTVKRIAFAIATYERTLVANQTPWDVGTLTASQAAGLAVFNDVNKGRCGVCHSGPLFSDDQFHNIGLTDPNTDVGRMEVTGLPSDLGRMKTPSLRNVGLRNQGSGRLFHNGDVLGADLNQVIAFYALGGIFQQNIAPEMQPLSLTAQERIQMEDFLNNGLTDARVANETGVFSRPTLRSESGIGLPFVIPGTGFADSNKSVPNIIVSQPANLQHPFFTIGVSGAWGAMPAFLLAGSPNTLGEVLFGFVPLGVGSGPLAPFIAPVTLKGSFGVHGSGYGSVSTGISNNPFYAGLTFFTQWVVTDPVPLTDPMTGNPIPGLGISLSNSAFFTVLP
ncbi:MAG: cytochrome c peroxidase [Planctomycetota bacterium]|jgi:cytochrome c peroxidase